jgi:hypothetical protein
MEACRRAGFGYSNQRRYGEARDFFANALELLELSAEDLESRMNCIQDITTWMYLVDEKMVADSVESCSELEDAESREVDPDVNIDSETMRDIPNPLLWSVSTFMSHYV